MDVYKPEPGLAWIGVIGGVFGPASLWLAWCAYRSAEQYAAAGDLDAETVAETLAAVVRRQWASEAKRRNLDDPDLPVRWKVPDWLPTTERVPAGIPAGTGDEIVEALRRAPNGRLVILGEPGAGKTMLAIRLLLGMLEPGGRVANDPTPVLVPVSSWDPGTDLHTWLEAWLEREYKGLSAPARRGFGDTRAHALLADGRILPILDGLDEIGPASLRGEAIRKINQALDRGDRLVVTCRTAEYRELNTLSGPATVRTAGVVEIEPLDRVTVSAFLADAARIQLDVDWTPVLATLAVNPSAPLSLALRTPLMVSLARLIYCPNPDDYSGPLPDPTELLPPNLTDREAVEKHLISGYVAAAYRPHRDPARNSRWTPDDALPYLRLIARFLARQHTTSLAWWELTKSVSESIRIAMVGLICGLPPGIAVGLFFTVDFGPSVASIVGTALGLVVVASSRRTYLSTLEGRPLQILPRTLVKKNLPTWLAVALGVGLTLTFMTIGSAIDLADKFEGQMSSVPPWTVLTILLGPSVIGLLATDLRQSNTTSSDPVNEYRNDRRVAVVLGLTAGVPLSVAIGYRIGADFDPLAGLTVAILEILAIGLPIGLAATAWGRLTVIRIYLSVKGEAPWNLVQFLGDAADRGVFRQAGSLWEFRHGMLQRYLADDVSHS